MSVILLILGAVMGVAGIAMVVFGIPINEFTLGTTLIIAGTTALSGGVVLIGLSAVVAELGRVSEALRGRAAAARPAGRAAETAEPMAPAPAATVITPPAAAPAASVRPPQPQPSAPAPPRPRPEAAVAPPPEPYPAGPSAVEVSAAAIERLRSSIPRTERPRAEPSVVADIEGVPLSPNNGVTHQPQQRPRPVETPAPEPKVAAEDRASTGAVEALKASRLDFLFRSKSSRPAAAPQAENFDSFWPADARQGRSAPAEPEPQPRVDQIERQTEAATVPAQDRRAEAAPAEEPRTAILKSGVVDGMAYTLYADGSIEAKLPHGTVRFGSIAELRAHIESNS
jgi:hypothetical protein